MYRRRRLSAVPVGVGDHGPEPLSVPGCVHDGDRCFIQPFAQTICNLFSLSSPTALSPDLPRCYQMLQLLPSHDMAKEFRLAPSDISIQPLLLS